MVAIGLQQRYAYWYFQPSGEATGYNKRESWILTQANTAPWRASCCVLPDARIEWRHVWIGAVVTALLFEVGKFGLGFYLGRESTASSFGAAGSVVVILLWVFYASCILLFGAEFTRVYARECGDAILPSANAVAVTAEGRAQQGLVPTNELQAETPTTPIREIKLRPPITERTPVGALLAVTTVSFVVGLLTRRKGGKE